MVWRDAARPSPDALTRADLKYVIQFQHPEKMLAGLPTQPEITDAMIAPFFGLQPRAYAEIRAGFAVRAREAAAELLENFDLREQVDRLPFGAGRQLWAWETASPTTSSHGSRSWQTSSRRAVRRMGSGS